MDEESPGLLLGKTPKMKRGRDLTFAAIQTEKPSLTFSSISTFSLENKRFCFAVFFLFCWLPSCDVHLDIHGKQTFVEGPFYFSQLWRHALLFLPPLKFSPILQLVKETKWKDSLTNHSSEWCWCLGEKVEGSWRSRLHPKSRQRLYLHSAPTTTNQRLKFTAVWRRRPSSNLPSVKTLVLTWKNVTFWTGLQRFLFCFFFRTRRFRRENED